MTAKQVAEQICYLYDKCFKSDVDKQLVYIKAGKLINEYVLEQEKKLSLSQLKRMKEQQKS